MNEKQMDRLDSEAREQRAASELAPCELQAQSARCSVADGWGHLSERTRKRLEEMVECGAPREAADVAAAVIKGIGADNAEWSIFADLKADPRTVELYHQKTGTWVECSVLGGPNGPGQGRAQNGES